MVEVENNVVLPEMVVEVSKDHSYMPENFEVATRIGSEMWADQKLKSYLQSSLFRCSVPEQNFDHNKLDFQAYNMQDVVEVDELAVDALYLTQMDVQLMNLIKCYLARLIPLAQHLLGFAKTLLHLRQVQECQLDHHQPMLNFQNCLKVGLELVSKEVSLAFLSLGS